MEWFSNMLREHGGAAISIFVGAVAFILFIAVLDRHGPSDPGDGSTKAPGRPRDPS